ncbi:PREDICTED: vacuolar fusion protein CCZ1 homolog B-like [Rhinopithecus bieti]|uniref:vacuolar fusion protein CCZ1 homolog B-like n=1 Tax=Rhinopithecus bieti TaxID=61621 RepID=UPI00083C2F1D|nr:PREDICTED: vacuolar fusion protein CCZ1 homolog B-like [Rhinopithecus bieti]
MAAAAAGAGTGPWAAQEKQFPPALLSFFIYNPRFGPREGEEENKILFYHPNEVEKNEKIRNVGLCEAIVQFTRTFSPSKPAKSLRTQKNRQFFNEPEEHFWMVMVFTYTVYLSEIFPQYLQTLHLQSCDLLDIFGGISFFPLDKMTYLKIQSFINRMEESLNIVKYTAFLYNDQLIWSGLEQDDMRILYKYLTTSLFPRHIEPELSTRDSPIRAEMPGNLQHYGRFLTGPLNLNDPDAKCRFPKIFVKTDDTYEELHLIVYKVTTFFPPALLIDTEVDLSCTCTRVRMPSFLSAECGHLSVPADRDVETGSGTSLGGSGIDEVMCVNTKQHLAPKHNRFSIFCFSCIEEQEGPEHFIVCFPRSVTFSFEYSCSASDSHMNLTGLFCHDSPASIQPTLDFCRRLDSVVGPQLTVLASDICEQFNINKRMSGFVLYFLFTFRH